MKRKLFLLTDYYPYGAGETFAATELSFLRERFDVTVIPRYVGTGTARPLPEGVRLLEVARPARLGEKLRFGAAFFLSHRGRRELAAVRRSGRNRPARLKKSLLAFASAELFWAELRENGVPQQSAGAVFYSFWYTSAALALAFHREQLPGARCVARTNGYDLYNERAGGGRQPFKPAADEGLDLILFSCRYGRRYYLDAFGVEDGLKYAYAPLGAVNDFGAAAASGDGVFRLLSCSAAVPGKRVERIAEALALLDGFPVEWTHIGGGELLPALRTLAEEKLGGRSNVRFRFTGALEPAAVHGLYRQEPWDCFITASASEGGCPVSIQEALSYGLPVIGTAVGGVTEMLEGTENVLLPPDPSPGETARALAAVYALRPEKKTALRQENRALWQERYDAAQNGRAAAELFSKEPMS